MVQKRDFSALAERFGYRLSLGRDPVLAIENDFARALTNAKCSSSNTKQSIQVKYFQPNNIKLYAVVQCVTPISQNKAVLVDLIVTGEGNDKHITLEDISYAI